MIHSVSNATHAQPVAPAQTTAAKPPVPSNPQPAPNDTVQISAAAQALKEAIENPAQTAKEAARGDLQAKRLLARETADKL